MFLDMFIVAGILTVTRRTASFGMLRVTPAFWSPPACRPYYSIVMEYADGGDLQQLLNKHKDADTFMGEDEALGYFVQICLGLKHIHDKSIVHRDIKSPNVFLTKDGLVKLGDFGVAKTLDHTAAMAQTQIGTPYYLSPEIVAGEQYNRKTDVRTQ